MEKEKIKYNKPIAEIIAIDSFISTTGSSCVEDTGPAPGCPID